MIKIGMALDCTEYLNEVVQNVARRCTEWDRHKGDDVDDLYVDRSPLPQVELLLKRLIHKPASWNTMTQQTGSCVPRSSYTKAIIN